MVDSKTINNSVLNPLMLRNRANTYEIKEKEIEIEFNEQKIKRRKRSVKAS